MSRKKRKAAYRSQQSRSTTTTSNIGFLLTDEAHDMLVPEGYTRLDRVPQIVAGFRRIAELAGAMTIHLMANTDSGDVRIKNELSRQIDINPSKHMTRSTWIEAILMNLYLYGDGETFIDSNQDLRFQKKLCGNGGKSHVRQERVVEIDLLLPGRKP